MVKLILSSKIPDMQKLKILTLTHSSHVENDDFEQGTQSIQAETVNFDHDTL
jgi:hypothetical protein